MLVHSTYVGTYLHVCTYFINWTRVAISTYFRLIGEHGQNDEKTIKKASLHYFNDKSSKIKYRLSDFPSGMKENSRLVKETDNLWHLKSDQRMQFLYTLLYQAPKTDCMKTLTEWYDHISQLQEEKENLEVQRQCRYVHTCTYFIMRNIP